MCWEWWVGSESKANSKEANVARAPKSILVVSMAATDRESTAVGWSFGGYSQPFPDKCPREAPKPWMVELNPSHFIV